LAQTEHNAAAEDVNPQVCAITQFALQGGWCAFHVAEIDAVDADKHVATLDAELGRRATLRDLEDLEADRPSILECRHGCVRIGKEPAERLHLDDNRSLLARTDSPRRQSCNDKSWRTPRH
jgi:hypothetical protein